MLSTFSLGEEVTFLTKKKLTQFQNALRLNWDPNTLKLQEKQKMLTIDTSNKSANNAIIPNSDNQSSHT